MNTKAVGGVLLILGTSIGAGMLALPVAAADEGIFMSTGMLVCSWLIMTLGAFLLLETNLWFPSGANIISMAKATLGVPGQIVAWLSYLLLLYALLCAYIAGAGDVLHRLLINVHMTTPHWLDAVIVVLLFGFIVFRGIYSVDIVNRGLISAKLIILGILAVLIAPKVNPMHLLIATRKVHMNTFMVMITSFGFAIIVPSLRSYFDSNVKTLKKVILLGSLLPLVVYLGWIVLVQGLIPREGANGLYSVLASGHATSGLMKGLSEFLHRPWVSSLASLFIALAVLTSFLGVSLCLTDFLADGLQVNKQGWGGLGVFMATFMPPLLLVIFWPGLFITALGYAGIFCIILLIILPILMALFGRYGRVQFQSLYTVPGKIWVLLAGLVFSIGLLVALVIQKFA